MKTSVSAPVFTLKDGAWLIADAHYAHYNKSLYDFLCDLPSETMPPQIILMGDIFDLLFGNAPNSIQPNEKMVDLLKQIARQCEVVYLEGNHDFGLKPIFGREIRVLSRALQPLMAEAAGMRVALHHGDLLQGAGYEVYTALIRNRFVDRVLNLLDTASSGAVIGWLERYNRAKEPCYGIDDFEERMRSRLDILRKRFDFDLWIEGHFHQNVRFDFEGIGYFNLPAFACDKTFTVIRFTENGLEFEAKEWRKKV